MFWVLGFPQFTQKKLQIIFCDGNLFDVVVYRVAVLTNVLGNSQLPGAVVVSQTLGDQERRMGKISREIGVDVVVQLFRGAAPVGSFNLLQNILPQQFNGLCCVEVSEVKIV